MKRLHNILWILLAVGIFTSCEKERITFDESMSFVAFTSKTSAVSETNRTLNIPVLVTATSGSPAVEVSFSVSAEGHANPAIEGTDFKVISANKLSFPQGFGYDTIKIQTYDNDVFTGTKTFQINLTSNTQSYDFGAVDTIMVSISDDDHPFGWMLGDYTAAGNLWRAGGAFEWAMELNPVENDIYAVQIVGLVAGGNYGQPAGDAAYAVYGKINVNEEDGSVSLTILTGQEIPTYGYGPCALVGWYGPDGAVTIETGSAITGNVVNNNGAVSIRMQDEYGWYITSGNNAGLYLDIVIGDGSAVNTVWTRN